MILLRYTMELSDKVEKDGIEGSSEEEMDSSNMLSVLVKFGLSILLVPECEAFISVQAFQIEPLVLFLGAYIGSGCVTGWHGGSGEYLIVDCGRVISLRCHLGFRRFICRGVSMRMNPFSWI